MSAKCRHEAWEETPYGPGMVSRRCADCRESLEPISKPSSDFQVGDRVSVEGVVTAVIGTQVVVHPSNSPMGGYYFRPDALTLVERPRRKLRVGSVWERTTNGNRFIVLNDEALIELSRSQYSRRDELNLDTEPDRWREVPVEELEREAQ